MKPELQDYLTKADRALKVAENLLASGFERRYEPLVASIDKENHLFLR